MMSEKYQRIDVSGKRVVTFEAEAPCLVHAGGGAVFTGKTSKHMVFLRKGDRISAHGPGYISVTRPGASQSMVQSQRTAATNEFTAVVLEGVKRRLQGAIEEHAGGGDSLLVDLTLLEVDLSRSIKALLH